MDAVDIYESLFDFEKKRDTANQGYPIHKKLIFDVADQEDIYDWIIANYEFEKGDKVLDAGCGVGYGSMKLAKEKQLSVTGISISPSEIEKATNNAHDNQLESNLEFVQSNFENAPNKQYDFIIAVESLKHSLDLKKSLQSLEAKMAPNGTMIIVEDFYQEELAHKNGKTLMTDWALVDLFRLRDYSDVLQEGVYIDLTDKMPVKNKMTLKLQNIALSILGAIPFTKKSNAYRIFRGGIALDLLFASKKMKYGVYTYKRNIKNA